MLELKNTVTEVKNALDGFINRLDTGKEKIRELQEMSIEDFPGGPVVKTLRFHCRGHGFDHWSEN